MVGDDTQVHVSLRGTFSYDWLPLADTILSYDQVCRVSCEFSPIPPASYILQIKQEGYNDFEHIFHLSANETHQVRYEPKEQVPVESVHMPVRDSQDDRILLEEDIQKQWGKQYRLLGRDLSGRVWIVAEHADTTQIGIYMHNTFIPRQTLSLHFSHIFLDALGGAIIGVRDQRDVMLFSLDMQEILQAPFSGAILGASFQHTWHILSDRGEYDFYDGAWQENERFSSWHDISTRWRIGYISKDDTLRLERSNYRASDGGVLILLDRKTGKIREILRNASIERIFSHDGRAVIFDGTEYFTPKLP